MLLVYSQKTPSFMLESNTWILSIHYLRECVESHEVVLKYISTRDNLADALTNLAEKRVEEMDINAWRTIVGVNVEGMRCEKSFRVLEWGGMEVH